MNKCAISYTNEIFSSKTPRCNGRVLMTTTSYAPLFGVIHLVAVADLMAPTAYLVLTAYSRVMRKCPLDTYTVGVSLEILAADRSVR